MNDQVAAIIENIANIYRAQSKFDLGFVNQLAINQSSSTHRSSLILEIVSDAKNNEVDEQGCIKKRHTKPSKRDPVSVAGICQAIPKPSHHNGVARIRCSAEALKALLEDANDQLGKLPATFVLAHELSHLGRQHDTRSFHAQTPWIKISKKRNLRLRRLHALCQSPYDNDFQPRQWESQADNDALDVVRILLDDMRVPGAEQIVSPNNGGLGEIFSPDTISGLPLTIDRRGRGEKVTFSELISPFRKSTNALTQYSKQYQNENAVTPAIMLPEPFKAYSRYDIEIAARQLLLEILESDAIGEKWFIPTLPAISHPDGASRLANIIFRLAALNNGAGANTAAVIERQRAEYLVGIAEPFCYYVNRAEAVPRYLRTDKPEQWLPQDHWPGICRPMQANLIATALPSAKREINIHYIDNTNLIIDADVSSAAILPEGKLLISIASSTGDPAIGFFGPSNTHAQLETLPCEVTSILADDKQAWASCEYPLALLQLNPNGKIKNYRMLDNIRLNGRRVDGYIHGDLKRDGSLLKRNTTVPGLVDRDNTPLMRRGRFHILSNGTSAPIFTLEFPSGGSNYLPFQSAMGASLQLTGNRLTALPLWSTPPTCDIISDPVTLAMAGSEKFGVTLTTPPKLINIDSHNRIKSYRDLATTEYSACASHKHALWCTKDGALEEISSSGAVKRSLQIPHGYTAISDICFSKGTAYLAMLEYDEQPFGSNISRVVQVKLNGQSREIYTGGDPDNLGVNCSTYGVVAWAGYHSSSDIMLFPAQ